MNCLKLSIPKIKNLKIQIRKFSSDLSKIKPQEVSIPVPWGEIRGKWWGPRDVRPILTIHGWQDNCGSFDRLLPHLDKKSSYLAIDLPGHGYSSRLPMGMYYHFMDYVITVKWLVNFFNWPKVSLMGHSLGGVTSYVYTMLYPDTVDFVICLDGAKPMISKRTNVHIAHSIEKFMRFHQYNVMTINDGVEPPSYTIEEIRKKICTPHKNSVEYEHCDYLIRRGVMPSKIHLNKYYFTRDQRLKAEGLVNFSQQQLVEFAQSITGPIFIAKAKGGSYYEAKENFYEVLDVLKRSSVDCDFHYVEGTHHVHLNDPETELAPLIKKFVQRHNTEDRSIGGLKEGIVVENEKERQFELNI